MGHPPTAHLLSEKWGQKNPRTPGVVHFSDPIFLTNSTWAALSRLFAPFCGHWPEPRQVAGKGRKKAGAKPGMIVYP
jgi:hypothetical protein